MRKSDVTIQLKMDADSVSRLIEESVRRMKKYGTVHPL
ncbi:hypothetical protein SEA_GODONK_221 [Gordonia phage GodonK]|nr:hypothetical protein HOV33_gp147 [Gordonia phage GodonK]QBZ72809.1 hypothetical protein SEA_GODONK_221 [Gordonia phage GodonK]